MISSNYRHIFSSTAAASPGTALVRSKKEAYDDVFTVIFQNGSVLKLLLLFRLKKTPTLVTSFRRPCWKEMRECFQRNQNNLRNSKETKRLNTSVFLPQGKGKHVTLGYIRFNGRNAEWRPRWDHYCTWGTQRNTLDSHLHVTVSLEERGVSTGKDDSRILPRDTELFQTHPKLPTLW